MGEHDYPLEIIARTKYREYLKEAEGRRLAHLARELYALPQVPPRPTWKPVGLAKGSSA